MQDKTDKIDDTDVDDFDDLDFDDLDTEDDFGDESWDDFDEPEDAPDLVTPDLEGAPAESAAAVPQKKSFIQKNFNLIVIAIALLGGGTFTYLKFGSALTSAPAPAFDQDIAAQNAPIDTPTPIEELSSDFPPMPAPIGSVASDQAIIADNVTDLSDSLTPLPDLSEASNLQPLADLDASSDSNMDLAVSDLPVLSDNPLDLPLEESTPTIIEDIETVTPELADLSVQNADGISLNEPLEIIEELPSLDIVAPATQEPEPVNNDLSGVVEELQANLSKKDKALEEATMNETKMSAELSTANTQIQALQNTVSALESQIQSLKSSLENKTTKDVASTPKANASETVKPKKQPMAQWVMRSARPGFATISPKDSRDFRQVETGDTVPGIGKIKSIQIENGRWVIRGSIDKVSQ